MTTSSSSIYPQTVLGLGVNITHSTSANALTTLVPTQTNAGAKIESISVTNTDTISYTGQLWEVTSGTNVLLGTFTIPASAGNVPGTPSVNVLNNLQLPQFASDPNGNNYMYLSASDSLALSLTAQVTSGQNIGVYSQGGAY